METKHIYSKDGARIAYRVVGEGPPLLLVHGGISDYSKDLWVSTKWIDHLKSQYTIITPDIRGSGESDKSSDPNFYDINNIIEDFKRIMEACSFNKFYYFGWSYGATIGFHMCKNNPNIIKAMCAGSTMGTLFSQSFSPRMQKLYKNLNHHKKNNTLQELDLTLEERNWVQSADLDIRLAQVTSWQNWPIIIPSDIKTQLAIYTGSNDNQEVIHELMRQEEELTQNNITLKIFEGLDHFGLISELDIVLPWFLSFFT